MCVCVCNSCSEGCRIDHFRSHVSRGAASISGSRCLTKTVQICCDMDRGRPIHVPAHVVEFKMCSSTRQEQVTLTQTASHGMTGQQVCVCVRARVCVWCAKFRPQVLALSPRRQIFNSQQVPNIASETNLLLGIGVWFKGPRTEKRTSVTGL